MVGRRVSQRLIVSLASLTWWRGGEALLPLLYVSNCTSKWITNSSLFYFILCRHVSPEDPRHEPQNGPVCGFWCFSSSRFILCPSLVLKLLLSEGSDRKALKWDIKHLSCDLLLYGKKLWEQHSQMLDSFGGKIFRNQPYFNDTQVRSGEDKEHKRS